MTRDQRRVAVAMATGLAVTAVAFLVPAADARARSTEARLAAWAGGASVPAAALAVAIARLAAHRFLAPLDFDGGGLRPNTARATLLQALIQNTLEQALLAIIAYAAWLLLGPADRWQLVPVAAALFAIGRLLFFAGYGRGAASRALGFALTFYPTVILLTATAAYRIG